MSKLLINESPLQLLPSLAEAIGLNEAIVLQQIQYWITNPRIGKTHNGRRYVRNSVREWQETNFPWWSESTIKRVLQALVDDNLIMTANLNQYKNDRTLWYTINYGRLEEISNSIRSDWHNGAGEGQIDPSDQVNLTQALPESTSKKTGEGGAHAREETSTPPEPQTSLPAAALQYFEHLSEREEDMAEPEQVWNGIIDLCEAFCEHSEERLPDLSTYSGAKADNWVRPADYLLRLVDDDAEEAVSLVKDTLCYMDHHGLAYSNLASIKSVARKIERGRTNGADFSANGSGEGKDRRTEFWEQYILPFCERRKEFGELPERAREIIRTIGGDGVLSDELTEVRIRYYQSVKENPYAHADA